MELCKEYNNVFTWTYDDLKTFDSSIMQHNITLNPNAISYQQKLRKMHPSLEPSIKKYLEKLLKARIIFPVIHTQWISNLVLVHKKSGDTKPCVEF